MSNIKDICEVDRILPIHQLNKLNEKGTERQNFFPISVVQAIFDKTGIRLDAIISSFNYLFLPWKGTKEDTRLQVVGLMRRKSLVVCYRDLDDKIIIETYISNDRGDAEWKKDENWRDFSDWIIDVIENIMGNLDDYPDIYEIIKNIIQEGMSNLVNNWLLENAEEIINNYLDDAGIDEKIEQSFNKYISSSEFINKVISEIDKLFNSIDFNEKVNNWLTNYFNEHPITDDFIQQVIENYLKTEDFINYIKPYIDNSVNNWMTDNLQPVLDSYFEQIQTYISNNERVIANALSRHEEDLLNIKADNQND